MSKQFLLFVTAILFFHPLVNNQILNMGDMHITIDIFCLKCLLQRPANTGVGQYRMGDKTRHIPTLLLQPSQ